MYDTVDVWMGVEDLVEILFFSNVDLKEFRTLARDELDAVKDDRRRIVEIVSDHDLVPGIKEGERREGANVARATVTANSAFIKR